MLREVLLIRMGLLPDRMSEQPYVGLEMESESSRNEIIFILRSQFRVVSQRS